jgi:vacuolar iron transporter family protein
LGISKRLDEARRSYGRGDIEGSARAHDAERISQAATEGHGGATSQYLGEMVYGGLDGIITTFAVVSGVAGARLDASVILILGLANLFADGFSMATGSFLSTRSEQEFYQHERQREAWEVDHFPEGERAELFELYREQGYTEEEAQQMVDIESRDKERWVDAMMLQELGMLKDDSNPLLNGLATLISFILAGAVPLLVYLVGLAVPVSPQASFPITLALSGLALFGLGAAKALFTKRSALRSGIEMLLVGGLAAAVAYVVGALLKGIGG